MGMLGGLALGGLLGAMLFGGGFEHINFFDILVFGVIAFMLYKLFAARRQTGFRQSAESGQGYRAVATEEAEQGQTYQRRAEANLNYTAPSAGFDTDVLFKKSGRQLGQADYPASPSSVPADFDDHAFLAGAKSAYTLLQEAWDRGDLSELRSLTTDAVFAELKDQLQERAGENRTEILRLDARLLEVRDAGSEREASVFFDVFLRESPQGHPTQVKEIWHFVRSKFSKQPTWFLDGIQQAEE
jgi:predicted lipid-binding transport protein (Tim44 family)